MQKAIITKTKHDGKVSSNRKENHFTGEYAVLVDNKSLARDKKYYGEMSSIITARTYFTGSTAYACIWINCPKGEIYLCGGGKAGGYGYHKTSAALQAAINDTGIKLSESISGVGESAMENALKAIAKTLGFKKFHIHHANA